MGLSSDCRKFLEKRMKAHERLDKMSQLVEVITAFSELSPNPPEEVKSIINEASEAKVNFIVEVVRAYGQEKPDKTITEFFRENYGEKARLALKPKDAIQEAIRGYKETTDGRGQE